MTDEIKTETDCESQSKEIAAMKPQSADEIIIVHLTDIHIDGPSHQSLTLGQAVADAVGSLVQSKTTIILAISGDIAQSGQVGQYTSASKLIDNIVARLGKWDPDSIHVLVSPGNHDCNYDLSLQAVRKTLIKAAKEGGSDSAELAVALADVKVPFVQFQKAQMSTVEHISPVQSRAILLVSGETICVDLIDTAWASMRGDAPGEMHFPVNMLRDTTDANLAFALAHHPPFWLEPASRRNMTKWYDDHYDYVFLGHEHASQDSSSVDYSGREPLPASRLVVGSAFWTKDDVDHMGFKCIQLEMPQKASRTTTFELVDGRFKVRQQTEWTPRHTNQVRFKGKVRLKAEFESFLEDIGTAFTHTHVNRKILLHDLFVFPALRKSETKFSDFSKPIGQIDVSELLGSESSHQHVVVVGAEQSGKTTLAKHLFSAAYDRGWNPILLDGETLKSSYKGEVTAWIAAAERAQYHEDCLDRVQQLAPDKRLLVLDNVHQIPGGDASANKIMSRLKQRFHHSITFTAHHPALSIIVTRANAVDEQPFWRDSATIEVMPLGNERRAELIRKWVYLGREGLESEDRLEIEVRQCKGFLDTALGKHGFPRYPMFVLLLLQQLENFSESKSIITSGSQGYLFETLITRRLDSVALASPINTVMTLLSVLARRLADDGTECLEHEETVALLQRYVRQQKIAVEVDKLLRDLENIDVVMIGSRGISFKYRYYNYYFLARDMARTIGDMETLSLLDQLVKLVHTERSTNVLTFLAHFGQEAPVIERLIAKARETYPKIDNCDLLARTSLLLRFRTAEQRLVLTDGPSKAISVDAHRSQDANGRNEDEPVDEGDPLGINSALKLIQVLGQVLKSRASDISGDIKNNIAVACIGVANRTMEFLYRILDNSADEVVWLMSAAFEEKLKLDKQKSVDLANSIFASIVAMVALACCSRAANAMSSQELTPLIEDLEKSQKDLPSRLMLLGARLHVQQSFPDSRISSFVSNLPAAKQLAMSVLKQFVARRMFYDPPDMSTKRSICHLLDIEIKPLMGRKF